jgi:hypothetical protein
MVSITWVYLTLNETESQGEHFSAGHPLNTLEEKWPGEWNEPRGRFFFFFFLLVVPGFVCKGLTMLARQEIGHLSHTCSL